MPGYPVQIVSRQSRLADPGRDSQLGSLKAHRLLEREHLRATSWRCNHHRVPAERFISSCLPLVKMELLWCRCTPLYFVGR